jgi:hypothetical protein
MNMCLFLGRSTRSRTLNITECLFHPVLGHYFDLQLPLATLADTYTFRVFHSLANVAKTGINLFTTPTIFGATP